MLASFIMLVSVSALDLIGSLPVAVWGWSQYVDFLEATLDWLARPFSSGAVGIVLFTILVKTLVLPLTVKSLRSSKAMQELQPKIKELQKKYGKDRQRISQETMLLYRQYGVNPLAGCLPILVQLPIFFGVYQAINNLSGSGAGLWAGQVLWLNGLGTADPWKILPLLAGVFQFVQTKMMRPANQGKITDPQQAMMNQVMNFMPLMVIVFGWTFASGPVLYWAVQSIYSVIQQWFITGWGSMKDWFPWLPDLPENRRLGYRPPRDLDAARANVELDAQGRPIPQGRFMRWMHTRMDEAQRTAETRQSARRTANGRPAKATTSATATPDPAGDETEADEDMVPEAESVAVNGRPRRASSSYQARVDAATHYTGRKRPPEETSETTAVPGRGRNGRKRTAPARARQQRAMTDGTSGAANRPPVPRKSKRGARE